MLGPLPQTATWVIAVVLPLWFGPPDRDPSPLPLDRDPGWIGHRNRLVPDDVPITRQNFGYRATNLAGGRAPGEVGGRIERSVTPTRYAKVIQPKGLDDVLEATGTFVVTQADGGSGALVGWFNHASQSWRTPDSLVFRIDGNGGKYWVFFEYGTHQGLTGGGVTFEGERYQTTTTEPFRADGTPHRWALRYDPEAVDGRGLITFTLDGEVHRAPLQPGHRLDGASFDRFGLLNMMVAGDGLTMYLDDLVIDGRPQSFDEDPLWDGDGNEVAFPDRVQRPWHDFGYTTDRPIDGGSGSIGGIIWRDEFPASYADEVGPLDLDQPLEASGRLVLDASTADSGAYLGWFDSGSRSPDDPPEPEAPPRNILALMLEGPSRVGHYLRPAYRLSNGDGTRLDEGPVIRPDGQVHTWTLRYDPEANDGRGRITAFVDNRIQTIDLPAGHREQGAIFDRFGLFNIRSGGHYVELYIDNFAYTKILVP